MCNLIGYFTRYLFLDSKACRTRELSAELTVTRAYWRKQVLPVCGDILRVFRHACQKSLKILPHTEGFCLRQCSRVNFCSADSSRYRIRIVTTSSSVSLRSSLLLPLFL